MKTRVEPIGLITTVFEFNSAKLGELKKIVTRFCFFVLSVFLLAQREEKKH